MKKDKILSEDFFKNSIIKYLSSNGWGYFKFGELHAQGVDIKAKSVKYGRYFFIETKGVGKIPQVNENNFVYSLGQIITRIKDNGSTINYYALGLPVLSAKIALRRLPWQIAKKLHLYIFSVDYDGTVLQYSWKDLQKTNKTK